MSEYQQIRSLEQLRLYDPEAYRKVIEQELVQARDQQVQKLAKFASNGHLTPVQIAQASCRQLREICTRFSITTDTGELFYPYILDAEKVKRKFARLMGLVPPEEQDHLDINEVSHIAENILNRSNNIAVIFGGSRFEVGKTPERESDVDINIIYINHENEYRSEIKERFETELQRETDIRYFSYRDYRHLMKVMIWEESKIALPFRRKYETHESKVVPIAGPESLIVAAPGYLRRLHRLAQQMPPAFSDQPYGDFYYRPTVVEFEAMNMRTTPEWYAGAVEALIQQKA